MSTPLLILKLNYKKQKRNRTTILTNSKQALKICEERSFQLNHTISMYLLKINPDKLLHSGSGFHSRYPPATSY